ncbi:DUF2778 domain-containing protein [Aquabacter sp. L1I39]|uniref:DUF2778 domain-containing protein n=1 Tax=Aquabacter sp. L1I39 TaxID=2820278 RepID=UPI001FFCBB61|nr:DUF2778 domain-containing protein [Aquabacter sp. L1I39]
MTYTAWNDEDAYDEPYVVPRANMLARVGVTALVAVVSLTAVAVVAAWAVGGFTRTAEPVFDEKALAQRAAQLAAEAASDEEIPPDMGMEPVHTTLFALPSWLYDPNPIAGGSRKVVAAVPAPEPAPGSRVDVVRSVPLPTANPLGSARGASDAATALLESRDRLASVPMPQRNPLANGEPTPAAPRIAALPAPAEVPAAVEPAPAKPGERSIALPQPGDKFAVYDIKGQTVYMPNGERLEAHSGYGDGMDNLSYVSTRMIGPTPPNVYTLTMRERLFHGVEALRMRPVGEGKMYGRDGFLTHSYLMGPRGDSNGCISFKDYDKFLAAYKRGEVTKVVVVESVPNAPGRTPDNPLIAWLAGNGNSNINK